jgi:hypothetical protein
MADMPMMPGAPMMAPPAPTDSKPEQKDPSALADQAMQALTELAGKAKGDAKLQGILSDLQEWVEDMNQPPGDEPAEDDEPSGAISPMESGTKKVSPV